jgi:hypothetical protein
MNSLSLARIMYGTNEDLHALASMNRSVIPSLADPTVDSTGGQLVPSHGMLSNLLHKAWAALHHKD